MGFPVFPPSGGGGLSTVTTSAPATGDGSSGSPVSVQAASGSQAGYLSASDFSKLSAIYRPKQGTALTDANQTIQPVTDKSSEYVQSTTLTTNRTKTLGTTSAFAGLMVNIAREDSAAFTLAVANGGTNGGTLFTFAASPTEKQIVTLVYNGTDWVLGGFMYVVR